MKIHLLIIIFCLSCISCNRHHNMIEDAVENVVGNRIRIPSSDNNFPSASYYILNYVDSLDCVPCRLQLGEWIRFHEECKAENSRFKTIFIAHPDSYRKVKKLLVAKGIDYIDVIEDNGKSWKKENSFNHPIHNTLLIDSNKTIIVCGPPFLNDKMKTLYKKQIARYS